MRIVFEGLIGSGKTTTLEGLAKKGYAIAEEPVDSWSLLKPMYEDTPKYVFPLQVQVLSGYAHPRFNLPSQLLERGPMASLNVFGWLNMHDGTMSAEHFATLQGLFKRLPFAPIDAIVYLDVDPELALQRIAWRHRDGEEAIDVSYLVKLQKAYEHLLNEVIPVEAPHVKIIRVPIEAKTTPHEVLQKVQGILAEWGFCGVDE